MWCADPFQSDETYIVSVLTLEELGATGNKGLASVMTNPVNQDILGGLAASATAFAAAEVGGVGCMLQCKLPSGNTAGGDSCGPLGGRAPVARSTLVFSISARGHSLIVWRLKGCWCGRV